MFGMRRLYGKNSWEGIKSCLEIVAVVIGGGAERFLPIITILFAMILASLLLWNKKQERAESARLVQLAKELYAKEQAEEANLKQKESTDSFYQKLADGFDVNILVVGDSIGEGAGRQTKGKEWYNQLAAWISRNYKIRATITNVSMGGNASYAGYVRTMALEDNIDYDLAIICYGQNDSPDGFAVNYESMIRAIGRKYPDCSMISILESSQREYTEKMKIIQALAEHYSIPVADTIEPFNTSEADYAALSGDGIHPNDVGQRIYFETVKEIISKNVDSLTGKISLADVVNPEVNKFNKFVWYGVGNHNTNGKDKFIRMDDVTYKLNVSASGILGIDYTYQSGENAADIYIDDSKYISPTVTFDYDFSQRHILVVSKECIVKQEIKIVFQSKEQADGFYGMCFSWE